MTKTGFEQTSVDELRQLLVQRGICTADEAFEIKGKNNLIEKLTSVENTEEELEVDGFDNIELEQENIALKREVNKDLKEVPSYNSPEWSDYVMGLFSPKEMVNDQYPNGAGLRRVAEILLGNIISSRVLDVKYVQDNENGPGRACAIYEISFAWNKYQDETIIDMSGPPIRTFSDAADVWPGNTDDLFAAHPVATAVSRAESRVLRKALRLRGLSAEELAPNALQAMKNYHDSKEVVTTGEWNANDKISALQETFITRRCQDLGIDAEKFINKKFYTGVDKEPTYASIGEVPKAVAVEMVNELNRYQTEEEGSKSIPVQILLEKGKK